MNLVIYNLMKYESFIAECQTCKARTSHSVAVSHDHVSSDGCTEQYVLAPCDVCEEMALFYREDPESEAPMNAEPTFWWEVVNRLWPAPDRCLGFLVPKAIDSAYLEAVKGVEAGLPMASSVMVGRALEAACKDIVPDAKGIHDGLKKMLKSGALSEEMYQWADSIRVLRNDGAHATENKFTLNEVNESLDFLQALLMIIYELRPKFARHRKVPSK
jgi:Domain of unknown function (DUF4145)